jgi:hypothetical protein
VTSRSRLRWGLGATVALIVAVVVGATLWPDAGSDPRGSAASSADRGPVVRDCRARVEGGRLTADRSRDTVIGPVAFPYLPANYRRAVRPNANRSAPPPGFDTFPIKALALVRSGARIVLVVPRRQRSWMQLLYDRADPWRGSFRVVLRACRRRRSEAAQRAECGWRPYVACRWRNTQFNGSIYVAFESAPDSGRCAELIVRVEGSRTVSRGRLFRPREQC